MSVENKQKYLLLYYSLLPSNELTKVLTHNNRFYFSELYPIFYLNDIECIEIPYFAKRKTSLNSPISTYTLSDVITRKNEDSFNPEIFNTLLTPERKYLQLGSFKDNITDINENYTLKIKKERAASQDVKISKDKLNIKENFILSIKEPIWKLSNNFPFEENSQQFISLKGKKSISLLNEEIIPITFQSNKFLFNLYPILETNTLVKIVPISDDKYEFINKLRIDSSKALFLDIVKKDMKNLASKFLFYPEEESRINLIYNNDLSILKSIQLNVQAQGLCFLSKENFDINLMINNFKFKTSKEINISNFLFKDYFCKDNIFLIYELKNINLLDFIIQDFSNKSIIPFKTINDRNLSNLFLNNIILSKNIQTNISRDINLLDIQMQNNALFDVLLLNINKDNKSLLLLNQTDILQNNVIANKFSFINLLQDSQIKDNNISNQIVINFQNEAILEKDEVIVGTWVNPIQNENSLQITQINFSYVDDDKSSILKLN